MTARCRGCVGHRERVGYASCKRQKLCRLVDIALIERHRGRSIGELQSIYELNGIGAQRAGLYVDGLAHLPSSPEEFIATLHEIHRRIFAEAEPGIAGRFRAPEENAYFGGEGAHRREGAPAREIQDQLVRLYGTIPASSALADRRLLCLCSARFLERFFMIHPYVDGNGRVARFLVALIARLTGAWRWDQQAPNSKRRRDYVQALEYAHIHTIGNDDPRCDRRRSALGPLSGWISRRLVEVDEGWDLLDEDERPA